MGKLQHSCQIELRRKWFEHGRESGGLGMHVVLIAFSPCPRASASGGSWSDFVLLIADIEVDEGQ